MGWIEFESWNVKLKDIKALNKSPEVSRLGLVFEELPGLVSASAKGNVAPYYCILVEVKRQLISGGFNVTVELSNGEKKAIVLCPTLVTENEKDITFLIR